ncbi:hypothetical protein [Nocardiopsis synnemataformans]|uniref:hypothetical protein n=1 Tax=Nocardiopsis synnemataformans TaxID=61305 RepID=UPI003EB74BFF
MIAAVAVLLVLVATLVCGVCAVIAIRARRDTAHVRRVATTHREFVEGLHRWALDAADVDPTARVLVDKVNAHTKAVYKIEER